MKNQKTESRQQDNRTTDRGCGTPGAGSQERITEHEGQAAMGEKRVSAFHGLPPSADRGLEALRFCVMFPRLGSARRSRQASDVVEQIRRRYRRRLGVRAKWREYVAELVGVSAGTVGAWRCGTQRPSAERAAKLREIYRALGKGRQ
jgi:hypothetical protein